MPTYDPILPAEVGAGQPITSSLITRLRDNPLALISATPDEVTATGNYNVPAGVTLLMVICVGGGGGGGAGVGGTSGFVKSGFISTTGSGTEQIVCTVGGGGLGGNPTGSNGGDTVFDNSITGKGGFGGNASSYGRVYGAVNLGGEQGMSTGGGAGVSSAIASGGGAGGVPWFLRTSSLGNGGAAGTFSGNTGGNATGRAAGGGGGGYWLGGNGTAGIIFVLPLQA